MNRIQESHLAEDLAGLLRTEEEFLVHSAGIQSSRMYNEHFCQFLMMKNFVSQGRCVYPEHKDIDLVLFSSNDCQTPVVSIEMKGPWRIRKPGKLYGPYEDKLVDDLRKLAGAADSEREIECFSLITLFGADRSHFGSWLSGFLSGKAAPYRDRVTQACSTVVALNPQQSDDREMQVFALRINKKTG